MPECPNCFYIMDHFDAECPRCRGQSLSATDRAFYAAQKYVSACRMSRTPDSVIQSQLVQAGWSVGDAAALVRGRRPPVGPAASCVGDQYWVPSGSQLTVGGRRIALGLVYAGRGLRSVLGHSSEPALLDPALPVASSRAHHAEDIGYWPTYERLAPQQRALYLDWLASDRAHPQMGIGYVFLFFYGLERRALADGQASPMAAQERKAIAAEVRRLLRVYGGNHSFRSYAVSLLDAIAILEPGAADGPVTAPLGDGAPVGSHMTRFVLGKLVSNGTPLPWDWSLAWWLSSDSCRLRTPAKRCPEEFRALVRARFASRFGPGLLVKPNKTVLTIDYQAASPTFGGGLKLRIDGMPDVSRLQSPLAKIGALVEECQTALEPYSRWLGRNPDGRGTLQSLASLPGELARAVACGDAERLRVQLDRAAEQHRFWAMPARELIETWGCSDSESPSKRDCTAICELLGRLGYGVEPDVRFHGPRLTSDATVVVFRLPEGSPASPSSAYTAAAALLHLFLTVAEADGAVAEEEQRQISEHIRGNTDLSPAEMTRLAAYSRWLMHTKPGLVGLSKRAAHFSAGQRESIRRFLVSVAAVDGRISPEEITVLQRLYKMLGVDPDAVHGDVHALAATSSRDRFATVVRADPDRREYEIPAQAGAPGPASGTVELDMDAVRAILADTSEVAALLGGIFADEEPSDEAATLGEEARIAGLDARHSALVRRIRGLEAVGRDEFGSWAEELGLLPEGALDAINDAAWDACDDPLLEGDETLAVSSAVMEELLTCK